MKRVRPAKTNGKRNSGNTTDNVPKLEDWEHKLTDNKYLEVYKMHKEGMETWTENKSKFYYLVLQYCPPESKTELKNPA